MKNTDEEVPNSRTSGWHNYGALYAERHPGSAEMTDTVNTIRKHFNWLAIFSNSRWGIAYERLQRAFFSTSWVEIDPDAVGTSRTENVRGLANRLKEYAHSARQTKDLVINGDVALFLGVRRTFRHNREIAEAAMEALDAGTDALTQLHGKERVDLIRPIQTPRPFSLRRMLRLRS